MNVTLQVTSSPEEGSTPTERWREAGRAEEGDEEGGEAVGMEVDEGAGGYDDDV